MFYDFHRTFTTIVKHIGQSFHRESVSIEAPQNVIALFWQIFYYLPYERRLSAFYLLIIIFKCQKFVDSFIFKFILGSIRILVNNV